MQIAQFLGHGFEVVPANTSVRDVARLMARRGIDVVLVRETQQVVGIVTERDLVARALAAGFPPEAEPISDVMTPDPVTITSSASVEAAFERMATFGVPKLCVMDGTYVRGVVTAKELAAVRPSMASSVAKQTSALN